MDREIDVWELVAIGFADYTIKFIDLCLKILTLKKWRTDW